MRKLLPITTLLCLVFATLAQAEGPKHVAMIAMNDTPQLIDIEKGIVAGMTALGMPEGKAVVYDTRSAQANFATAQQIVREFVGDQPDLIVAITTAPAQAAVASTKSIPIVFSAVTDPILAKLVPRANQPGGNVTGVSDEVPYARQMELIKQIIPNLKHLGIVFDPGMDSSRSSIEHLRPIAPKMGFDLVLSPAVDGNSVAAAGQNLVGKVEAVYVPNDTTVYAAFESLVKVGDDAQLPIFSGERASIKRGAIATIGYDFPAMGRATAGLMKKVLDGANPGSLDVIYMLNVENALKLSFNKTSAAKMGVTIPSALLAKADEVF